jgi:photosystem II stability/assembly factor-like uncharacterized protein
MASTKVSKARRSRARRPAPKKKPQNSAKRTVVASKRTSTRRRPYRLPWYRRGVVWIAFSGAAAIVIGFFLFTGGAPRTTAGSEPVVGGDLHSIVLDPTGPSRLYVGGHQGVAASRDEGRTWRQIDSLAGADAMGWAFTSERILVGGHPGLYVSRDGGRTFRQENEGLPATDIHALGAGDSIIYAASPQAGVFSSTDGGTSWDLRTREAGQAFMGSILVDPEDENHIVAPDMQNGVVESTDGGRTWRVLHSLPGVMSVTWDRRNPERIIAASMSGAAQTEDGGATWNALSTPAGASVIEIDPRRPNVVFAGALEGDTARVWVSRDGGATWT